MKAPRSVRRGIPAALLALAVLGCTPWGIMLLRGRRVPQPRGAAGGVETCVFASAVAHCERRLVIARARAAGRPDDGPAHLSLAGLEFNRAGLLALVAYETRPGVSQDGPGDDYLAWRERFLRGDPEGALTLTSQAARAALRSRLDPDERRLALLLLASALRGLADYHGEAAALAELARREPQEADYWLRLADAYARARRFARAEAAMGRGLKLLYARNLPRREASREAAPPAPTRRG
jgi:hypothetical protein